MNDPAISAGEMLAQADLLLLVCDLLRRPGLWEDPGDVGDLVDVAKLGDEVGQAIEAALAEAARTPAAAWADEHHRLFEGATVCPANQTAYVRRDKGAILGDMCGFYRAFGFSPRDGVGDKPDHLVAELEFVAMLLVMQSAAIAESNVDRTRVCRGALSAFAAAHVAEWINSFCERLASTASLGVHGATAVLLQRLWVGLASRHDWAMPAASVGAPQEEPESPYECGMAELTVQGGAPPSRV